MRRHAQLIGANDSIFRYDLPASLKSNVDTFVLQQKAMTADEIMEAAHLAKLTMVMSSTDNAVVLEQLAQLKANIRCISLDHSDADTRTITLCDLQRPNCQRQDRQQLPLQQELCLS